MPPPTRRGGFDPLPSAARFGAFPRRARCIGGIAACLLALIVAPSAARTVIVPDQFATIQRAIDSGAYEILVRPGSYAETPVISRLGDNDNDDVVIRGLIPPETPLDSLPAIAGVVFDSFDPTGTYTHSPSITIRDLRLTRTAENQFKTYPFSNPFVINFQHCALDSGLTDKAATTGGCEYYVQDCRINGPIHVTFEERIILERNEVLAPFVANSSYLNHLITLNGNTFRGPGPVAVRVVRVDELEVWNSTFDGFEVSVVDAASPWLHIEGNTFTGPGSVPVQAAPNSECRFFSNRIKGFETGILLTGTAVSFPSS